MASASPRNRRSLAGSAPSPSEVQALDPALGARRREGFLLAAFALLFVVGVWTVVVSELMPESSAPRSAANVTGPTQKQQAAGK